MPPLPVINDTFRVVLNWQIAAAGRTAVNVIHVTSNSLTSPTAVGEAVKAAAPNGMFGPVFSGAIVDHLTVTPLDGVTASVDVSCTGDVSWEGLTGGQRLDQVACLVKFTTAKRGREFRGRLYMPFISEGAIIDGVVQDLGPVQTAWETFLDNLTTADVDLVIASYKDEVATFVNNVLVETRTATQRRRNKRQ